MQEIDQSVQEYVVPCYSARVIAGMVTGAMWVSAVWAFWWIASGNSASF